MIHLFPKAKETLEYFKSKGVGLCLMTNGGAEQQRSKIKRFGLEGIFDVILVEGEIGFGKPDSQVYAMALDSLKLEPNTVWSVGDNLEWDVWGPQQLGIYGIWNDVKNWDFQILLKSFLTESYALLLNWSKLGVHSKIAFHICKLERYKLIKEKGGRNENLFR